VSEGGKQKASSNGTFMFLKSHSQSQTRAPSDLIPVHDGMVISFVNYEIKINFVKRSPPELQSLADQSQLFFKNRPQGTLGYNEIDFARKPVKAWETGPSKGTQETQKLKPIVNPDNVLLPPQ